jgi:hypothetical protein
MKLGKYSVYHATWSHFNSVYHKSLPSLIPTLKPVNFWAKTLILLLVSVCIPHIKFECLNLSLWKLVCISWHLSPSQILHCLCVSPNFFVFYALCVTSKESKWSLLHRISCFILGEGSKDNVLNSMRLLLLFCHTIQLLQCTYKIIDSLNIYHNWKPNVTV